MTNGSTRPSGRRGGSRMARTVLVLSVALAAALSACGGGNPAAPPDTADGAGPADAASGDIRTPDADAAPDGRDADAADERDAPPAEVADTAETHTGPPAPLYTVTGPYIRDRLGRVLVLRGVNVATGDLERWQAADPGAEAAAFADIAASGFNAIRLPINWDRIEPNENDIRSDYLDLVERHVRGAAAAGLSVLIDLHQDLYGTGFNSHGAPDWTCDAANYEAFEPREPWFTNYFSPPVAACFDHFWQTPALRAHFIAAARHVAERVRDVPAVLGFDPFNEPAPGTTSTTVFERDVLLPFYEEFAAGIAEALPGRLTFIEPMASFSLLCRTTFAGPVTTFPAVFAPHYYNPSVETALDWDGKAEAVARAVGCATAAQARLDIPLAYGELGGAMQTPDLGDYLAALFGALDAAAAGSFLWIYTRGSAGFGLLDEATGTWNRHAWAFLRPAPAAIAGTPRGFAWDPTTRHFSLAWQDDGQNPTDILLPTWVREAGYTCTCDGLACTPEVRTAPQRLVVPPAAAGAERTFTLDVPAAYPAAAPPRR